MSAAERLVALFVAPAGEAPAPAGSDPPGLSPGQSSTAPESVEALSSPGKAVGPESGTGWPPSPAGVPSSYPSSRPGKRRKPRPARNTNAPPPNACAVDRTSALADAEIIDATPATPGGGTQAGGPRLRVVPLLDDGGAEPAAGIAPERLLAAALADGPAPRGTAAGDPTPSGRSDELGLPAHGEEARTGQRGTGPGPALETAVPATVAGFAASLDACGLRVCILGGGDRAGSAFASAVAARLARLPGARCAVVCAAPPASVPAPGRPPGLPGPSAPAARRVARGLALDGYAATVRGRVVELAFSDAPESVVAALAAARGRAPDAPMLTLLPGSRRSALDAVVGRQDLVMVVVAADASSSLSALAVAELSRVAPGAVVRAVPLPGRLGAAARRAAVTHALEALR